LTDTVHRYIGLIRHVIMFIVHVRMVAVHKDTLLLSLYNILKLLVSISSYLDIWVFFNIILDVFRRADPKKHEISFLVIIHEISFREVCRITVFSSSSCMKEKRNFAMCILFYEHLQKTVDESSCCDDSIQPLRLPPALIVTFLRKLKNRF
jgi:hypothetical protein